MRKLINGLLGLLLMVAVFLTVLSLPAFGTVFSNDAWVEAFLIQNVSDGLVRSMAPLLMSGQLVPFDPRLTANLTVEQGQALTALLLPPGWAEQQIAILVLQTLDFLRMETNEWMPVVDLNPVKQSWREQARPMADFLVSSWPPCSQADLLAAGAALLRSDPAALPICQPQGSLREQVVDEVERAVLDMEPGIPAQFALLDAPLALREARQLDWVRTFQLWYRLLRWGAVALVGLMVLLTVVNWKKWRVLTAVMATSVGMGGLLAGLLSLSLLRSLAQASFVGGVSLQTPVEWTVMALTAYMQVMTSLAFEVLFLAALCVFLGLLRFVVGRLVPRSL